MKINLDVTPDVFFVSDTHFGHKAMANYWRRRGPIEVRIDSESTFGLQYTVTLYPDGANTCTCPDYRHRRHRRKHIDEALRDHT